MAGVGQERANLRTRRLRSHSKMVDAECGTATAAKYRGTSLPVRTCCGHSVGLEYTFAVWILRFPSARSDVEPFVLVAYYLSLCVRRLDLDSSEVLTEFHSL